MKVFRNEVPDCDVTFEAVLGTSSAAAAAQSSDTDKSYTDSEVSTVKPSSYAKSVYRRPQKIDFAANGQKYTSLWGQIGPWNSHPGLLSITYPVRYNSFNLMLSSFGQGIIPIYLYVRIFGL